MKRIFITLISDQSIPNVQYIKEFSPISKYYFISTNKMEAKNRSQYIMDSTRIPKTDLSIMIVNEEDYNNIISTLNNIHIEDDSEYYVNCTLGTKIMSIALFDFFKQRKNVHLLYTPIGTNKYKHILTGSEKEFRVKVTVEEYFACYGISISKTGKCLHNLETATNIFNVFLNLTSKDFEIFDLMREREVFQNGKTKKLRGRDDGARIMEINGLKSLLEKIKYSYQNDILTKYDVQYLTGGWFEEWIFFKIKSSLNLADNEIQLGVLCKNIADNDLDVVFLYRNDLFVIECKTTMSRELQLSTLYKSGALIDKFGRAAKGMLFTLQDLKENGKLRESIELRARQQNIKVLDRGDFLDFDIKNYLK
jgi:hypothetical protein